MARNSYGASVVFFWKMGFLNQVYRESEETENAYVDRMGLLVVTRGQLTATVIMTTLALIGEREHSWIGNDVDP